MCGKVLGLWPLAFGSFSSAVRENNGRRSKTKGQRHKTNLRLWDLQLSLFTLARNLMKQLAPSLFRFIKPLPTRRMHSAKTKATSTRALRTQRAQRSNETSQHLKVRDSVLLLLQVWPRLMQHCDS